VFDISLTYDTPFIRSQSILSSGWFSSIVSNCSEVLQWLLHGANVKTHLAVVVLVAVTALVAVAALLVLTILIHVELPLLQMSQTYPEATK
jgi:hypothetical protein